MEMHFDCLLRSLSQSLHFSDITISKSSADYLYDDVFDFDSLARIRLMIKTNLLNFQESPPCHSVKVSCHLYIALLSASSYLSSYIDSLLKSLSHSQLAVSR